MPYQPVDPGYELFDGTNVNIVSAAINALSKTNGLAASYQLPLHQPGQRLMTGDFFNAMSAALKANGRTSPVATTLQIGHRMFTGDVLNKMAKSIGVY